MCYYVLTQHDNVISISKFQIVTNLELATSNVTYIYHSFDEKTYQKLNLVERYYVDEKTNPEYQSDIMDEDEYFFKQFHRVYNDRIFLEADGFTPEVLEDKYLNIWVALPHDGDGTEFSKVTQRLRDSNGLPIGAVNDNPILDIRVYGVDYQD